MRMLRMIAALAVLAYPSPVLHADEAQTAKEGLKEVHSGMKKVTKAVGKKAKKDLTAVDKHAKKTWKKAGEDIKKTVKD